MKSLGTFEDLIEAEVQDLYSAEMQFAEALPKVAQAVGNSQLREAVEQHAEMTRGQIERLEQIAQELGVKTKGKKCIAAEALIKEGQELIDAGGDPDVIDAGLIGAAQRMEHYEIAGYGTLAALAKRLGNDAAAKLAHQSLEEERQTDERLTRIAERSVNRAAAR